jgi:hypothetical protein
MYIYINIFILENIKSLLFFMYRIYHKNIKKNLFQ